MRADYLTYRTATSVSIKGLILQAAVAISLLVYGLLARDHSAVTIAGFAGIGILAWLALTIVYDQHRRERIEALEVDALAQTGGASSSVFQTQDDLRPAARRLAGLHKFFIPIVSIVIAVLLLSWGGVRLMAVLHPVGAKPVEGERFSGALFHPTQFSAPSLGAGWPIAMGIVIALVGFVMARYTAGMAKQKAWANLRGGAAFLVGTVLLALAMSVASTIGSFGPDGFQRYMTLVAPCFALLIGVEIVLNFIMSVYRPRRAGEVPRAAFDSRLLGVVAAPDRIAKSVSEAINYQLGFDVTGGWFYQLLSRAVLPLVGGGVLIVWLLSGVTVIQPHQRAMVLRWGKPLGGEIGPGLHLKAPWPIDEVYVPEYYRKDDAGKMTYVDHTVTGLRVIELGTSTRPSTEAILWTNDHAGDEVYQFVRASKEPAAGADAAPGDGLVDLAMVSAELPMHFVVSDVRLFDELGVPHRRDEILRSVAVREVTRFFQGTYLDQVLGFGREEIGRQLTRRVQAAFDALNTGADGVARGAGVRVVSVAIAGIHPPKAAAPAFESPVAADARRVANRQNAEADAIAMLTDVVGDAETAGKIVAELDKREALQQGVAKGTVTPAALAAQEFLIERAIVEAGGGAASTLAAARATRWERHMSARGQLARYGGQVAMYEASPRVYMTGQYLDALKGLMDNSRVYILDKGARSSWIQLNLEDKTVRSEVFGETGETDQ